MQVENWNDLRFLLALHRAGTLTAAAAELGVDQTTVTRRLRALEGGIGAELYEKLRGGAVLTRLGEQMVVTAQRLELEMLDFESRVSGSQVELEGPVRMTMPSTIAVELVEEIRDFAHAFPGIELEIIATDDVRNITKREADIAVRVASRLKVPRHLVGRKVARYAAAVFGVAELQDVPWPERPWVGWVPSKVEWALNEEHWRRHGQGPWALKVDNPWVLIEAVRAGAGVTVFACGCPKLTAGLVEHTKPAVLGDFWILTHPDLLRSPRIRATLDYWYAVMERRADGFSARPSR